MFPKCQAFLEHYMVTSWEGCGVCSDADGVPVWKWSCQFTAPTYGQKNEIRDEEYVPGLSLTDRVRNSVIPERLWVKLLLLHIERSQLMWFRPLHLQDKVFWACQTRRTKPGHAGEIISLGSHRNTSVSPWRRQLESRDMMIWSRGWVDGWDSFSIIYSLK